jgi:hypothetical protein
MNSTLKKPDNCFQSKKAPFFLKTKRWGFLKRKTDTYPLFPSPNIQKLDGVGMIN